MNLSALGRNFVTPLLLSPLGFNASRLVDGLHFLSAGAVSFARGLNDTPKVAALRLVATTLNIQWGLVAVAMAMAVGGLLNARKVADVYTDGHVERL